MVLEQLENELARAGHDVISMDLPSDEEEAALCNYPEAVCDSLPANVIAPIVLGHLMSGLVIPIVAAARRVQRLIYLTPMIPTPGMSALASAKREPPAEKPVDFEIVDDRFAAAPVEFLYNMCTEEDKIFAIARTRLQALKPLNETYPLTTLPEVDTQVILGSADQTRSLVMCQRLAADRLVVNAQVIHSDHSPFFSAPSQLALFMTRRDDAVRR